MFSREITIINPTGLHARPASQLTAFCKTFPEKIKLEIGTVWADPKSIISVLAAGIKCGSVVKLSVEGEDESDVGEQLAAFFRNLTE